MQRNDSKRTSLRDTGDVETPESKLLDPQNALEQCERTDNNLLVDVLEYDESESEEFVDYDSSDDNLFTMSKLPKVQEEDKYSDEDDKVDNDEDTDDVGFRTTYGDGLDECVPIPLNEDIVQTTNEDNSETTTTGYEEAVLQRMNSFVVEDASNSSFSVHTPPTARGSLKSTRITGNSLPNISSEDNSGRFTRSTFSRVMSVRKSRLDDDRSSHRRSKSNVKDTELCRSSSGRSACRTTSRGDDDSSSNSSSARRSSIISSFRKSRLGPKFSFRSTSSDDSIRKSRSSHHRIENRSSNPIEFDKNATASAAESVRIISVQIPARRGVQFGFGEFVLVQLSRLSVSELDKDFGTVSPVNKFGYPIGEGKTEKQKHGPYKYVLCSIRQVHFDEDERYYTVKRLDTGAEQRADLGFDWMEPIRNYDDIEVAMKAAKHSKNSAAENEGKDKERVSLLWSLLACPLYYFDEVVRPFYKESRQATKVFLAHMLHGDHKYACNIRFTGINFLVLCSVAYLFLDVVVLAFVDAEHDHVAAIVGITVWFVLVVELIFEYVIRPSNYLDLIQSDKAFAPSTARHINWYHLICEILALLLFVPQLACAFSKENCGLRRGFSSINSALIAVNSTNNLKSAAGRFCLGLSYLRVFGLVRHWKQMWINHTFERGNKESSLFRRLFLVEKRKRIKSNFLSLRRTRKAKVEDDVDTTQDDDGDPELVTEQSNDDDRQLKNAATIGTALMLVNSHRALFLLLFIVSVFPVIYTMDVRNPVAQNVFSLLQANNVLSNTTSDCDYLKSAVMSWLLTVTKSQNHFSQQHQYLTVQWAQVLPIRCEWQYPYGVITSCGEGSIFNEQFPACEIWQKTMPDNPLEATPEYYAKELGTRPGELTFLEDTRLAPAFFNFTNLMENGMHEFIVRAIFNESHKVAVVHFSLLLLLSSMLALVLIGLTAMRGDAARLVLFPLQRMLKIVVRYAENPLSTPTSKNQMREDDSGGQLGHFETEQLINAIAKIADLLRKCWGVAGAGIISSNLARTKSGKTVVFNPTIPGKRVYALFGFVGINEFDKQLRSLDKDVMKLINDVARVVHDEVYRWALGDSGQCNKNLGGAFLMVFRIGDFTEVHDRKKRATDVVFNTQMKKGVKVRQRGVTAAQRRRGSSRHFDITSDGTLQLASLPGIQTFTDRALLGFLKSFAGLHRDQNMQKWEKDFRLSAGVGTFTINVIYGMDAGWAVEGAVGSEYKIDATYLSPHVNMASRMMSACKQYGVKLLMSQAVEELLSKPARAVMRHLDTVYVKGSNVAQRIYTYDARYVGVDFFLFERSPEQADVEADAYNPTIWTTDQDLKSMRQHVSDEFHDLFRKGVEHYIEGEWKEAIQTLQDADYMMLKAVIEEGYIDYDYGEIDENDLLNMSKTGIELERIRNEYGDGACKCLVQYMQRRDGVPPADWHGVRKLDSK